MSNARKYIRNITTNWIDYFANLPVMAMKPPGQRTGPLLAPLVELCLNLARAAHHGPVIRTTTATSKSPARFM